MTFVLAGLMGSLSLTGAGGSAAGILYLQLITVISGVLGALLTLSIGAADTPVVITVLNSY